MRDLLILAGVVFGINLLPAFAPPTWTVLVYFRVTDDIPIAAVVVVGALCAAVGRLLLALSFRGLGAKLPRKRRDSLTALAPALQSRRGVVASLLFFAFSPIPSNTLFEAAGLARVRLRPLVAAFFAGRLGSYSLSVSVASHVATDLRSVVTRGVNSPQAIAVEVLGVVGLVAMVAIDWPALIEHVRTRAAHRRRTPA